MKNLILLFLLFTAPPVSAGTLAPMNQAVVDNDIPKLKSLLLASPSKEEVDNALGAAAVKNNVEAAQLLLKAGANANKDFGAGHTSIIISIRENNPEVLHLLLEHGGNPNASDLLGWRPLHHTTAADFSCVECIHLLIKKGAVVDARDSLSRTPLHRAAGFGQLEAVKVFISYGADKTLKEKYGKTAYERAMKNGHKSVADILK